MITKSNLKKMDFPYHLMGLTKLFSNPLFTQGELAINSEIVNKVLGEPLIFDVKDKSRPYIYNSVVMSIDGKIAFEDAPEGPFIASKNIYAQTESLVDWWLLNLLRSSADAILFGANTLKSEPTSTGHIYDQNLEDARILMGKNAVPINVIPTLDGLDIPYDHIEFHSKDIPVVFFTVLNALPALMNNIPDLIVLGPYNSLKEIDFEDFNPDPLKKYAMVCGSGSIPDPHIAMHILFKMGVRKLLVESPMITHLFLKENLMDELFINISCVYVGGEALSIGKRSHSFTSSVHPHTELLKVFMKSPHFLYTRHRVMEKEILCHQI